MADGSEGERKQAEPEGKQTSQVRLESKTVVLGPDHEGMRIDASGVLCTKGSAQFRKMMLRHLEELADRYYAGNAGIVDEFLQLYCLGTEARKAAKEKKQAITAAEVTP